MKIIDKTPFQNEQGQVDLMGRLQGTLKYGPSWFPELEAQKVVIAQMERLLEKGFVLIRNFNLPGSEIIVPLILVGTHGITVIYVTHLKGFYEAKGDQWNKIDQGRSVPARANLINRVVRLARATQVYLDRQKITVNAAIEPVLIAADPGLNIDSMRPAARIVKSDAIKQFASSLLQNRSVLRPEQVFDYADRIITPRAPEPAAPGPVAPPPPVPTPQPPSQESAPSRARAIFDSGESSAPFDPSELSFAFEEEPKAAQAQAAAPGSFVETSPDQPLPAAAAKPNRILGMTPAQLGCLGIMALVECCALGVFVYYLSSQP